MTATGRRGGASPRGGRRGAARSAAAELRALERLRLTFGPDAESRKTATLGRLIQTPLRTAREVARLHEALAFAAAYPDSPRVEALARAGLATFATRGDLRRRRAALANSGIAGTALEFRFYWPTARWLAARWPQALRLRWDEFDNAPLAETLLGVIALPAEGPALDEYGRDLRAWIARMKRDDETDAAFLVRRFAELPLDDRAREALYDRLDVPMRLEPMPGTPSRTLARSGLAGPARCFTAPPPRARPTLAAAAAERPRAVRALAARDGAALVDLARGCMVTRRRDLDAFAYADPRDVRVLEFQDGLAIACLGVLPARRLLLESLYGWLALRNGVPVAYGTLSALYGSAEVAYNLFDTWRGAEAAPIYGRVLATATLLFGADTFVIDPYQLGHDNDEAIASGAWWFYRKLGFAPRARDARALMRREEGRRRRAPARRTGAATLMALARRRMFATLGPGRDDVLGALPLARTGLAVMDLVARRFGSDRARAERACVREAAALLHVRSFARFSADEREAWRRWAPLVVALPGVGRWGPAARRALVDVVRAKGGRREDGFVRRFDAHRRLRASLRRLVERTPER